MQLHLKKVLHILNDVTHPKASPLCLTAHQARSPGVDAAKDRGHRPRQQREPGSGTDFCTPCHIALLGMCTYSSYLQKDGLHTLLRTQSTMQQTKQNCLKP